MELTSEFFVPLSPEETWNALLDFARVARAMPGARLDEVNGDQLRGSVTVRLGPMKVEYGGTAHVDASDPDRRELRIEAKGNETRGTGSASARIGTRLTPIEGGTSVEILAEVDISGRPAQMGAGLLQDVAKRLTDEFADRLRGDLMGERGSDETPTAAPAQGSDLDLGQLIRRSLAGRVALGLVVAMIIWLVWRAFR